ncbi:chaplin family protein [Streptomyces bottropensis]|uniref:chaplin family protein n=1 Tax=Streptomyces bottropensis TaxID=42235 RepID=UPI0036D0D360
MAGARSVCGSDPYDAGGARLTNFSKKAALTVTAAYLVAAASSGAAVADSSADSAAVGSPGVASGLVVQVPVDVPVTVTGLGADLVAALNPTFGNVTVDP